MNESSKNKPHLLLVDDDKSLLRLLTIRLEGEGYQVTAVEDGNAALRKLQNDALIQKSAVGEDWLQKVSYKGVSEDLRW